MEKRQNSLAVYIINFVIGIIEALIGLRIILKLFGANQAAPFVQWIYSWTDPLLGPFRNIFPSPVIGNQYVIELPAIFSLLVYGLLAYFLTQVVLMLRKQDRK